MKLTSPLTTIKGVGPAMAAKLAAVGLQTAGDVLEFFPRRHQDFSEVTEIASIAPGNLTIKAEVESVVGRYVRRGLHITEAVLSDGTAKTRAVWFNQPYRAEQIKKGERLYFSGSYELQRNRYILSNPATEREADFAVSTGRIVPIYPEAKGIKSLALRRIIRELVPLMQFLPERLPPELIRQHNLMPLGQALQHMHFPESPGLLEQAKHRFAFEELLELLLASLLNRQDNSKLTGYKIPFQKPVASEFITSLPFSMTAAQKRSAWEILQDFTQGMPMNRLLQGDVGSGKTVVAAMASFMAIRAGYQVALMAPTEILAAQHAATLAKLLQPLGVEVGLLVGSVKPKARALLQQHLADGHLNLVVGTHALIQKDTQFANLGLVVIDEQHRFGVEQRATLLQKSTHMPHLLSMTATPIPRSLQLTVYGELEISIIDELPAGRHPIKTQLISTFGRKALYQAIDEQLEAGRQAYVVCPRIDESNPESELKSVQAEYDKLNQTIFKHRRLGLLHGQQKPAEKDDVMRRFKAGELDMLISTTVVEVGVDVPNATVMLIEGAERFGLAQLHQLRGRVGRGAHQSYCFLVPSSGKKPSERLLELEQSQDGFYLAEVDLRLRGPGEIYGRMQHGQLDLKVATLGGTKLIKQVRAAAQNVLDSGLNLLQYEQLYKKVGQYRRLTSLN